MLSKFKRVCDRYGYKIVPVMTKVNGTLTRRPDILAVEKYHEHIVTIPKEMRHWRLENHTDLGGRQHPDFFECEAKLYNDRFYVAWQ